jgi:hypothetical protein
VRVWLDRAHGLSACLISQTQYLGEFFIMPPRQFRLAVSENYKPRNNLDVPTINRLLKELKFGHKNVRSSQKQLFTEMHLLERVYYKGKNQHGLSLFWRSVASVRRMAARVYETNLPRLLEILGSMFHEEPFEG